MKEVEAERWSVGVGGTTCRFCLEMSGWQAGLNGKDDLRNKEHGLKEFGNPSDDLKSGE